MRMVSVLAHAVHAELKVQKPFEAPSVHQPLVRWIFGFLVLVALNASAAALQLVRHTFAFDVLADSPDAEVLDYRYGESRFPGTSNPAELREQGKALQAISIYGAMRKADSLYVKWRVKSTDQVHEDTVDLGRRLPGDFTDHRVYFIVKGPQLYVYLITPERRPPDMPPNGPSYLPSLEDRHTLSGQVQIARSKRN